MSSEDHPLADYSCTPFLLLQALRRLHPRLPLPALSPLRHPIPPPPSVYNFAFMKLVFEVKTKPVTQAFIIIAIVAVSSGSLASITIYSQETMVCIFCFVILAFTVYI